MQFIRAMQYTPFSTSLLLLCLLLPQTAVAEATLLTWYQYNLPPYHILQGAHAGQGPLDQMYRVWQATLPEYRHQTATVNIARMSREFRSDRDHRCIIGSFVFPESTDKWVWSRPVYVEPPAVIVTRHEVWERWGRPESIDLAHLLADRTFRFGHFERVYGGAIDQQIKAASAQDNVITIASHASGESLMKMLHRGRVDYILEYPPEIRWLSLSQQLDDADRFATVAVLGHTTLSPVHVGCARTAWGQQTIDRLNAAITESMRHAVWKHYQRWLATPTLRHAFLATQAAYFKAGE